ncbi:angiopoietin-2 [Culex quinquefasciatus]|uniref:Angiopoietin-2 n=1 Tax=Culex quinquefasciatus TaxID=7176 RepID=B0XID0_CULQU|nr:angiopoietin-2 [Culex quinquefasciatus]|eukprot:XP_001869402.1 angiopoietin-2 [Culex quinquefasciatus]
MAENSYRKNLTERLTTLETTGDAILSRQRSTEGRINELTVSISTLGNQSRQILKNHNDLVVASCDMPTISGIYRLQKPNMNVFCEMVDAGGRWLYIQRRISDDVIDFERNWFNYVSGFGKIGALTSFWLGLEALHQLTSSANYELLIGIKNEHNVFREARYSEFKVSGANDGYRLTVGGYSGTAGDMLHNNAKFSTFDRDNDSSSTKNCAKDFHSGWWFDNCRNSNLNGPYEKASNGYGIEWGTWADAAKFSKMMIRRK